MKSILFSSLIACAAFVMTGCEPQASTVVDSGSEDKVAEYNAMVAEDMKAMEEAQEEAEKGGAE